MAGFELFHLAGCGFMVTAGTAEMIQCPREIHQFRIRRKRIEAEPVLQFLPADIESASPASDRPSNSFFSVSRSTSRSRAR